MTTDKQNLSADSQPTPEPKPGTTPPPTSGSPLAIRNLFPGMVIGILVGIAGFLAYQKNLPQITQTFYVVTLTSFGVLILTFLLLYAFKKQISALIFGSQAANAGEIIEDAQKVSDALTDRFAEQLLKDVPADVRQRVRFVLPRLANWFVWSRFRNWWWQWVLGIFVSLGGLTGTLLLMNQNALLEAQNVKIDSQTILMQKQTELAQRQMSLEEASRRSALVVLMSNIMDKVDREIENQQKGLSQSQKEKIRYRLSQSLIGQIAALSHSFKSYRYMEGDTLIERPLSPERGQLLMTLTLLPLDTATLNKVYQSATFQEADLKMAILDGAYLSGVDLNGADLSMASLNDVNLSEASLTSADLSNTSLHRANLYSAMLDQGAGWGPARLDGAMLLGANLSGAYMVGTDLGGANLSGAFIIGTDLSGANLGGAFFGAMDYTDVPLGEANLREANLEFADLREADLSINQLSKSKSLFECHNLHDSLKTPLEQSHPHLFQKPKEE
jgi:uncharacterized protein YjbI with pentapeptide repeats